MENVAKFKTFPGHVGTIRDHVGTTWDHVGTMWRPSGTITDQGPCEDHVGTMCRVNFRGRSTPHKCLKVLFYSWFLMFSAFKYLFESVCDVRKRMSCEHMAVTLNNTPAPPASSGPSGRRRY